MADIFLSYARASHRSAKLIASKLRASGFTVWFDEQLPAHRTYSDVIEEQLEAAKAVVVLWSADAIRSHWVRSEANRARESGRLVQVRLDGARLPMPFDQIQCADLRNWSGSGRASTWQTVEASIASLAGSERQPGTRLDPDAAGFNRRNLIIGGSSAAVLGMGGVAAWRLLHGPRASPEAQLLLQKGLDALQQNDALDTELPRGAGAQAVALLTQAAEANPESAQAWGGLAMAYAVRARASTPAERAGYEARSRAAARRAFVIEKNELRALAAVRMLQPVYRNWEAAERAARDAVKLHPTFPIHIFLLSDVLGSVGRWREAADISMKANRSGFLIPGADRKSIVNLWAAGRLQEADTALAQAVDRWPEHPQVWRTRMAYLMFSGRPAEALALIDSAERPAAIPGALVSAVRATARTLAGATDVSAAVGANLAFLRDSPASALQVVQALTAIGDGKTVLSLLHGYYFGEGDWAGLAPPGGDRDRHTAPLFLPPMRNLWNDRRFGALLARIGLEDHWRRSGTVPDFRRSV